MQVTIGYRMSLVAAATVLVIVAARPAQQVPADLPLAQTTILKTYETGADGLELYQLRSMAIEPLSGALWVHYGKNESDPPIRIDRKNGAIKTIGRTGAGPDEYTRIIAMVPGAHGDIGIWDPARRLWFWVDSAGRQARTWSLPTNSLFYGGVFSDTRGMVYLKQNASNRPGDFSLQVMVRLDSALGLRDSTPMPYHDDGRWSWSGRSANGSSGTRVSGAPTVLWGVDARGRMFAAWSDSNVVLVKDGARFKRLLLPDYREALPADERARASTSLDEFEANMKRQSMTPTGPRPPLPDTRAQIRSITPEMNGGLAIVRTRPCASVPTWRSPGSGAPAADPKQRCAFLERFDAEGRRLRPLSLSTGDFVQVVRGDTVWTTRETRDQLVHIIELVAAK